VEVVKFCVLFAQSLKDTVCAAMFAGACDHGSAARSFGADYSRTSRFESHSRHGVFVYSESEAVSYCTGFAT
jgi:hypothetical protein